VEQPKAAQGSSSGDTQQPGDAQATGGIEELCDETGAPGRRVREQRQQTENNGNAEKKLK
jgi:hypothetical protein